MTPHTKTGINSRRVFGARRSAFSFFAHTISWFDSTHNELTSIFITFKQVAPPEPNQSLVGVQFDRASGPFHKLFSSHSLGHLSVRSARRMDINMRFSLRISLAQRSQPEPYWGNSELAVQLDLRRVVVSLTNLIRQRQRRRGRRTSGALSPSFGGRENVVCKLCLATSSNRQLPNC